MLQFVFQSVEAKPLDFQILCNLRKECEIINLSKIKGRENG